MRRAIAKKMLLTRHRHTYGHKQMEKQGQNNLISQFNIEVPLVVCALIQTMSLPVNLVYCNWKLRLTQPTKDAKQRMFMRDFSMLLDLIEIGQLAMFLIFKVCDRQSSHWAFFSSLYCTSNPFHLFTSCLDRSERQGLIKRV